MRSGWLAAIVALTLPGTAQAATPVFAPIERTALPTNANPSIRFGKLNADARPDFVTARWEGGTQNAIVIGRSSPGGGFDITTLSPQQGLPDPAIGDINGDGRGDIVHLGSGGVRYLLQAADGTFAGPDQGFGGSGWQLRFANLNGDARADVLIGGSSTMTRFLGTANGLSTAQTIAAPGPFTVADVDADGYDDIAYLNAPSGNNFLTVGLRLNDTTGGFRDASTFHLNRRGEQIYVTDTNSDGHQDVVVTDRIDGTAVLLGGPTFTLGNPQLFARRDDNYESIMADGSRRGGRTQTRSSSGSRAAGRHDDVPAQRVVGPAIATSMATAAATSSIWAGAECAPAAGLTGRSPGLTRASGARAGRSDSRTSTATHGRCLVAGSNTLTRFLGTTNGLSTPQTFASGGRSRSRTRWTADERVDQRSGRRRWPSGHRRQRQSPPRHPRARLLPRRRGGRVRRPPAAQLGRPRDSRVRGGPQCGRSHRSWCHRERRTGRTRGRPQARAGIRLRRTGARVRESGARHDRRGTARHGDQHG